MAPEPLAARVERRGIVGDALGAELEEADVVLLRERDVEPVNPRHRLVGRVVVAVEMPARRQQEIAAAHAHRIAVDDGPHAFALDHEAEGVLRMAMLGRGLARPQILDGGPQRRADIGAAAEAGIGEADGAALAAAANRHEFARPCGKRVEPVPLPDMRNRLRRRHERHQIAGLGPERVQVLGGEVGVELAKRLGFLWAHVFAHGGGVRSGHHYLPGNGGAATRAVRLPRY